MQVRTVPKGGYVLYKGAGDSLVFLLSGRLQVVDLTEDGREVGLSFLSVGDYLGELSILDDMPRSASVMACEARFLVFCRKFSADLIYHQPIWGGCCAVRACVLSPITELSFRFPMRISGLRLLSEAYADVCGAGGHRDSDARRKLPSRLIPSRETVSRAIQTLVQKGIVERRGAAFHCPVC